MKYILIVCLLFYTSLAMASDKWTFTDSALEATFVTMAMLDRSQTLQLKDKGAYEYFSGLLGKYPTDKRTNRLFFIYIPLHAYIAWKLSEPYRRIWQVGFIVLESYNVYRNEYYYGISASIKFF
jgi:hypothetical protein